MSDTSPSSMTAPPPPPSGQPTKEETSMAMLMYILAIITQWVGPLIIWLVKKDTSPFINDQGKEVLNFQITMFIATIVGGMLIPVFFIGCVVLVIVAVGNLICSIMGAIAVSKGQAYRFPFALRLIK